MAEFVVVWRIDIEADSPEEAAAKALIIQRDNDPANTATVFEVTHTGRYGIKKRVTVDLSK